MPIRPENRARYPADWKAISLEVRERAGWVCEGSPAYPKLFSEPAATAVQPSFFGPKT